RLTAHLSIFLFTHPAPPHTYTLSLHDALPILLAFARTAFDGSAIERPREVALTVDIGRARLAGVDVKGVSGTFKLDPAGLTFDRDRKSTRLNFSHRTISYAVFCLKKKKE